MRDYIDLVLCETCNGKREVFRAPAFSHLSKGEMVIVETDEGEEMTNVVSSLCISPREIDELAFITKALKFEVDELRKIKSKVVFRTLEYKEDENGNL